MKFHPPPLWYIHQRWLAYLGVNRWGRMWILLWADVSLGKGIWNYCLILPQAATTKSASERARRVKPQRARWEESSPQILANEALRFLRKSSHNSWMRIARVMVVHRLLPKTWRVSIVWYDILYIRTSNTFLNSPPHIYWRESQYPCCQKHGGAKNKCGCDNKCICIYVLS